MLYLYSSLYLILYYNDLNLIKLVFMEAIPA